ncbi:MAG: RodZ domain-containing protein [Actinomycetota bacterium]
METEIGPTLREARIRRKIDLSDVEQRTKIRVRYLRALENEEWDVLPGPAYTRSFIRTYANFLGLDGERLADDYRRSEEAAAELPVRGEPVGLPPRQGGGRGTGPRLPTGVTAALISVALIVLLLVIGGLTGGSDEPQGGGLNAGDRQAKLKQKRKRQQRKQAQLQSGKVSLDLTASADVWVCVLDASGSHLVNGQILTAGAQEGPFRSGRFDVSFGNGGISMRVNGKDFQVPESANPLGYRLTPGKVRPLTESERPTCE